MKCIFFGSPDFAVASLEALLKSKHQVVGVITQPDRPSGRGLKLEAPEVKKMALQAGLPVFQPEKVNSEATHAWLSKLNPDIFAVVAYGEFLGEKLLKFCSKPPVNVHPSLLPDLRGAAPMQWALLRGYKKSGVSTQFMVKEMDAGDTLLQIETEILENENAKELHDRLKLVGADLLVKTLDGLERGSITPQVQDSSRATLAPLLNKEQGLIDWQKSTAAEIHNQIRGLYPWPSAYCTIEGKRVKILSSRIPPKETCPMKKLSPGEFMLYGDNVFFQASDSFLEILNLQPEGKRPMLPRDFVNGMKGNA